MFCSLGGPVDVGDGECPLSVCNQEEVIARVHDDVVLVILGGRLFFDA